MEVPHYSKFGQPTSSNGALYHIKDEEGLIQAYTDIIKSHLQANGIVVTPDIEQEIVTHFRQQREEYEQQLFSEGIPEKLETLISFTKKSKLVAYCKRIKMSEDELVLLIRNCSQIGFKHRSKFIQFVPENRKLSDSNISDMKEGNPRKLSSKVRSMFEERKKYHVHLFDRGNEWHCFYCTYKDMESEGKNHWELGSHLHYVSYLWPNYRKRQIWESFDKRIVDIQGVHIQLETSRIDTQESKLQFPSELIKKFK